MKTILKKLIKALGISEQAVCKMQLFQKKVAAEYKKWKEPAVPPGSLAIAINQRPRSGPWGGGNQFLNHLISFLRKQGIEVRFSLKKGVQTILVMSSREESKHEFFLSEIKVFKKRYPDVRCIHRINDCDALRGTSHIDEAFRRMNEVADVTIFLSEWHKGYFADRWFDSSKPSKVIYHGFDPAIFYPGSQKRPSGGQPWRIVTHHWSDNPNKGWPLYKEVDRLIASRELPGFELTVIGNWPEHIQWESTRALAPLYGKTMADELRRHHIYITATRGEPDGFHHIEGAQCGLPVVYHEDGGGVVELCRRYGVGFRDDVISALKKVASRYEELHAKVLKNMPSAEKMYEEYMALLFPIKE